MRYVILVLVLLLVALGVAFTLFTFRPTGEGKADDARAKAEQLQVYAKVYSKWHDDKRVEDLADLTQYAEDGERAIYDPWGKKFRHLYVIDPKTGRERLIIWTVFPKTGEILAAPSEAAEWIGP